MRSEGGLVERLRDHYQSLAPRRIGIAVSGGSDSLALLCAAHAWSKDGRGPAIEAVTVDHGVLLLSLRDCEEVERLEVPPKGVYAVAFSPDGLLAAGCADKRVRVWAL